MPSCSRICWGTCCGSSPATSKQVRSRGEGRVSGCGVLAALVMLIPIVMVVLSLTLTFPAIRWVNLAAAVFLVLFNLVGLPYPGVYDNFLIVVGFVFNGLIVWYAWTWT